MDENKSEVEVITEKVKASAIAIIHAAEEVVKPVSKALGLVETEPVTKYE